MLLSSRSYWASRYFPLLAPDGQEGGSQGGEGGTGAAGGTGGTGGSGAAGGTGAAGGESKDDLDGIEGLGDKGKEAIRKEREAAKAAATRAKDAEAKLADLEKEKSEREAADQKKKDEDAAAAGKWEELATKREGELKSAKDEAATLKAENDQLREAMKNGIDAGWKELPEEVRKIGEKGHGEDDVLGRWQFLHDADTQALVKKLNGSTETKRGNEGGPKSNGSGKIPDADKQKAQAGLYQRF